MSDEVQIDQATYDRLIAEGKSERIARAKAKAASVRMRRQVRPTRSGRCPPTRTPRRLEAFRSSRRPPAAAAAAAATSRRWPAPRRGG